jgi:hypothetical protein
MGAKAQLQSNRSTDHGCIPVFGQARISSRISGRRMNPRALPAAPSGATSLWWENENDFKLREERHIPPLAGLWFFFG